MAGIIVPETKYLNLAEIYRNADQMRGAQSESRLNEMKLAEYQRGLDLERQRNELAAQYYRPSQPEMNITPQMTSGQASFMPQPQMTPSNPVAQGFMFQAPVNVPAQSGGMDYAGYQNALYTRGDVQGAMAAQEKITADKNKAFEKLKNVAGIIKDIGPDNFKALQPTLAKMMPELAQIDASSITSHAGGSSFAIPGPDGKPTGKIAYYDAKGEVHIIDDKQTSSLPYKMGERQKFIGKDGNEYEGTFKGLDPKGEPVFESAVKVKKEKPAGAQSDFRNESAMRKEFLSLPEVKEYPVIEQQSSRALKALSDPNRNKVAVDQSIITTFNKMLDPTSVVRESEYARTSQDMAILNRIKGKLEKLATGGAGLTDDERQAMYRMVTAFKEVADSQYNQQVDYYSGLAQRYGYRPENIVRLGGKKAGGSTSNRPLPKF